MGLVEIMSEIPWYQTFFGEDYLRIYSPFLTAERTERDVEGIVSLLNLPSGSQILDLACGNGRHAIPLTMRGYKMTGQDLSSILLKRAEVTTDTLGLHVHWLQEDMRKIPFEGEFDAVINMFTSFGYLPNQTADQQVLQQIQQALKPNGIFLLETVHLPRILRASSPHGITRYQNGLIVLEERRFDLLNSRHEIKITMIQPDGQRSEYHQSIRIYTLTELVQMLAAAGLTMQAYYGGLDHSSLSLESRMVLLSRKLG
jgi:SAM-dependent methyltransferase